MLNISQPLKKSDDMSLVMLSLGNDRAAFCEIVTRYQNLLCSIAYAALGDIKQSEDLAQEVFIEAWQKLDTLKEPVKLKAWLCGILRFKISHHLRKAKRQPTQNAEDLAHQELSDSAFPSEEINAINAQERTLLWETLSSVDLAYREPLILFYRQQHSVERVAEELDLSIDAAKQRLSRGRKQLKETMLSFVETTLEKSAPGTAFTVGVVSVLGDISKPVMAASVTTGAAKTAYLFKFSVFVSLLATLSGLISSGFGLRASLYQSRTENERRLTIKVFSLFIGFTVVWILSMFGLKHLALTSPGTDTLYTFLAHTVVILFIISYVCLTKAALEQTRALRAHERIFQPEAFTREIDQPDAKNKEYKSKLTLLGYPLIHFQFGTPESGDVPAVAWIAGGAKAYGLIFAWGMLAVAPISVGIFSFGILTVGAVGFGLLSLGAVAIGVVAFGSSAIGFKAYSSLSSLGWESAFSAGFATAKEAAVGAVASAKEVNNDLAYQISDLTVFAQTYQWLLLVLAVLVIVPAYLYFVNVKKRMKV
jgi:RNA polymerase sigma factor (sigma-70 family)